MWVPTCKLHVYMALLKKFSTPPSPCFIEAAEDTATDTVAIKQSRPKLGNPLFSFIDPYGYRGVSLSTVTRLALLGPVVFYLATHTIR